MNHLLIIDPQNDFCDIPGAALPVPGADADMRRLAGFVRERGVAIGEITVTLDSHSPVDIAHPAWWQDRDGAAPSPFTAITVQDVEQGLWRSRDPARQAQSLAYVRALAAGGKYTLVVWPEHCLVGSWGHNIHAALREAIDAWSRRTLKPVHVVFKGLNATTEHYSAARAEVPDPNDEDTALNTKLVRSLDAADRVIVAGEALSHCVAATVRDLDAAMRGGGARKMTLLTDCTSPVSQFEALGAAFVNELSARGMRTATTAKLVL
jgi:nicotinamidase-related amidase